MASTYSHQCFPSVETGISQLDHLQAKWMQTQATTGGVYCRLKVVRWRLTSPAGGEKQKAVSSQAWTAAAHTTARWTDTAGIRHPSALIFFYYPARSNLPCTIILLQPFPTRFSKSFCQPGAPGHLHDLHEMQWNELQSYKSDCTTILEYNPRKKIWTICSLQQIPLLVVIDHWQQKILNQTTKYSWF